MAVGLHLCFMSHRQLAPPVINCYFLFFQSTFIFYAILNGFDAGSVNTWCRNLSLCPYKANSSGFFLPWQNHRNVKVTRTPQHSSDSHWVTWLCEVPHMGPDRERNRNGKQLWPELRLIRRWSESQVWHLPALCPWADRFSIWSLICKI